MSLFTDVFSAIRARQWIKNLLLLGAPIGAAVQPSLVNFSIILRGVLAFCLISSVGYIFNDWIDRKNDRIHFKKKLRPFAAGRLDGFHAFLLVASLISITFVLTLSLPGLFMGWLFLYAISTASYSLIFKQKPVIELLNVAFGFLVRCLAGAALFEVYVSQWFLIVAGFGSLFLISSKRLAELKSYSDNQTRAVINRYSEEFLNTVITASITITIMAYALWAFEVVGTSVWGKLSILPVLLGVLRYLWHTESVDAETPEKAILSDVVIPLSGIATSLLLILAIYT
jgi:decaprenyl-phosphate phosphoribosyltransferase